jgi:N-acetylmuramoyl-L-alanine amidase
MKSIIRVAAVWCLAAALALPGAAAAAGSPPSADVSAASGESADAVRLAVTATILNVRGEPSLDAAIVGKLRQGAVVEKLDERGGWFKIRLGSLVGWAHSDYLAPADGGPGARPGESASPPDGADGVRADTGGAVQQDANAADQPGSNAVEYPDGHAAGRTDGDAAARPELGDSAAGAEEAAGSRPKVIGRGIRVAPERQVETEGAKIGVERAGYVTGDAVRVRSGPGREYAIEGHLNRGDRVTVTGVEGEWYSVVTEDGLAGWIAAAYVGFGADGEPAGDVLPGKIIVVDPGHGGNDSGTIGTTFGTYEKALNLSTAIHLKRELELRGATVVMTRVTDEERPSLRDRVAIAEQAGADAFVSIHYNSAASRASGILTFYYSGGKDRPLAAAIERRLAEAELGLASNGISFGNFHVMRENSLPAVLLELGFLTNPRDEELARTESYQLAAARAIALGLEDYFASIGD